MSNFEERFWPKIIKTDGCWLWVAWVNNHGYGQFFKDNRNQYAHRVSFELSNGPIPDGLLVLHKCDIPACVRPDHLFLGTHKENSRDMVKKGRHNKLGNPGTQWKCDELHPNRKLSDQDVSEIRQRRANGESCTFVARAFGINPTTVSKIVLRQRRFVDGLTRTERVVIEKSE